MIYPSRALGGSKRGFFVFQSPSRLTKAETEAHVWLALFPQVRGYAQLGGWCDGSTSGICTTLLAEARYRS